MSAKDTSKTNQTKTNATKTESSRGGDDVRREKADNPAAATASAAEKATESAQETGKAVMDSAQETMRRSADQAGEQVERVAADAQARGNEMAEEGARMLDRSAEAGMDAFHSMVDGRVTETLTSCLKVSADGIAEMSEELTRFTSNRLEHDRETMQALQDCKAWTDLVELQQSWLRRASQDYFEEMNRLMSLSLRLSDEMMRSNPAAALGGETTKRRSHRRGESHQRQHA